MSWKTKNVHGARWMIMVVIGLLAGLATFVVGADVALAHQANITGVTKCPDDGGNTFTVNWTVRSFIAPADAFWTIDGVTKPVPENFTFTTTHTFGGPTPTLTKTATWSDGPPFPTDTVTGTVPPPTECRMETTTTSSTTTTTTTPETTTTAPATTTTQPATTTTQPGTTTTAPATTTTQPQVTTTASSVVSQPPVPPVTTTPPTVAQEPPVPTVPPNSRLPVTGTSDVRGALAIAFLLVGLGGAVMFARRRPTHG